jgi:hypothetical protein
MRFAFEQRIHGPLDAVARVFVDPNFYEQLAALPKLGRPELLSRDVDGDTVHLRVRYRFTGELSSAVTAVVDPRKLTWVEDAVHELGAYRAEFRMIADHYADRFACSGSYWFAADGDATVRHSEGDLKIRMPLVGGRVERAIVSGIGEHLDAEVAVVEGIVSA